jgi:DHA1 family tetracycline resistance protein-like MFS transporter
MDRRFIPLFLIVFVDLIGFGIVIPVLLLHAEASFGATDLQATGLLTAYSLGLVIAGPILGRLSDAYGRRLILILSQIGTLIGFIILGLANSLFLLYLGRIIDGLSGGNITTAQAYINDITTEKNRARGFGLISAAFGAGFIVGPALGGLVVNVTSNIPSLAPYSQNSPFFVAALFSLISILGTYFILPESLPPESRSPLGRRESGAGSSTGILEIMKLPKVRTILSFTFVTFLAFSLLQSSFPLFTSRNIFSDMPLEIVQRNIGLLLTWVGVISVTMQSFFVGSLVRRFGEQRLIVFATAGRILAFLGIGLSQSAYAVAAFIVPLSVGNAVSQPSLQSMISRFASPEMRGRVLGFFQSTNSLTLIIGPLLAGLLLDLDIPSLALETIAALPMFTAAGLVTIAFMMSFGIWRMKLPTQEATSKKAHSA